MSQISDISSTFEMIEEIVPSEETEIIETKKKNKFNYPQKFRKAWLSDPMMSNWLDEVEEDPSKGYCVYCEREVPSKYHQLKLHYKTLLHQKNVEEFPERKFNKKASTQQESISISSIFDMSQNDSVYFNSIEDTKSTPVKHLIHNRISSHTHRLWQCAGTEIHPHNLMYPLFVIDEPDTINAIACLPEVYQYGINKLQAVLEPLIAVGLSSVYLYPVCTQLIKDYSGTLALAINNPTLQAIKKIKSLFPSLTIACDVCLCPFTSHGHCGILSEDGIIDNDATVKQLSEIALLYAQAGAKILVPSDMMDGRVGAIKVALQNAGLSHRVSILSCAAKFASAMCREFKEVNQTVIEFTDNFTEFGDRRCYQIPPGSSSLALKAVERDIHEGCDMVMVMPASPYLDIVRQIKKKHPNVVLFLYQVSGEYGMLQHGAASESFDFHSSVIEILTSMRRAGADVIISYLTPIVLSYLKQR